MDLVDIADDLGEWLGEAECGVGGSGVFEVGHGACDEFFELGGGLAEVGVVGFIAWFGEEDVECYGCRFCGGEEADEVAVDVAAPWPAAEVGEGGFIDADDDEFFWGFGGPAEEGTDLKSPVDEEVFDALWEGGEVVEDEVEGDEDDWCEGVVRDEF